MNCPYGKIRLSRHFCVSHIEDLKSAVKKMRGAKRRSFQTEMTEKYFNSSARIAERIVGWGRDTVKLGLAEKHTGIECIGAQSGYSGAKLWEEKHPQAAIALRQLAEADAQQEPTFQTNDCLYKINIQRRFESATDPRI